MHQPSVKYYNQNAEHLSHNYQSAEATGLHKLLGKWLPAGGEILEIGCGSGRDTAFMISHGCKIVACDASENMLGCSRHYLNQVEDSESVYLLKAEFPLPSDHFLLSRKFDAVVSLAVLMHIPENELFDFAYQIKTIIKRKGIFICSFSSGREVSDDDPRLFVNREPAQVQLFFERIGFRLLFADENPDGLGRNIQWHTLIFESEGSLGIRPVDQIEAIINRDKKVTTYKLALLRAMCEISQNEYLNVQWHAQNQVSLPLGLICEKWIYYYWPLVEAENLIPQMNGYERTKKIAYRKQLSALIDDFRLNGGLSAFHVSFRSGKLSSLELVHLRDVINAISGAIVKGPVKYAGGALENTDRVFSFHGSLNLKEILSREDISKNLGRVYFDAGIWREMCLVGHWIGEAIILRWAELVREFSNGIIPVAEILSVLLVTAEIDRDVALARSVFEGAENLNCVWSNKPLIGRRFDIDHIIPFSIWHNNDLWNLVPSDQSINNQKRDKIITRNMIFRSEDRIVHYWRMQKNNNPERFNTEINRTLLGENIPVKNWERKSLSALADAVELVAVHRGIERWELV